MGKHGKNCWSEGKKARDLSDRLSTLFLGVLYLFYKRYGHQSFIARYIRYNHHGSSPSPLDMLIPPLPFNEHGQKVPQIKLGPEAIEKGNMGILMTLPEEKVAETVDTAGTDEEIDRWTPGREHVGVERVDGDALRVGIRGFEEEVGRGFGMQRGGRREGFVEVRRGQRGRRGAAIGGCSQASRPDLLGDASLRKGSCLGRCGRREFLDRLPDRRRHLVARSVWKADVQDGTLSPLAPCVS